jgi:hypothetical protein
MKYITGIGGIFFKASDPEKLGAWYKEHFARREGVTVDERAEKSEFGYFGWAMDPEGNRIELWEPPLE